MRKKWNTIGLMILIIMISATLVQCSVKSGEQSNEKSIVVEDSAPESGESSTEENETESGEKVVTNIYTSIETTSFDSTVQKLEDSVKKYGGYIENSNIGYSNYIGREVYKSGSFTVRVPSEKEDLFRKEAEAFGNVISESTSKSDITKTYRDTESKLKLLEVKEERLLAILEEATEIEDIIKLEESLNEVIFEKEQLKSQISDMDNQVSYSTVEINLLEVKRYSTGETPYTGFWRKIGEAFRNSIYVFRVVVEKVVIFAIYALPFVILGLLGYAGFRRAFRKYRKK